MTAALHVVSVARRCGRAEVYRRQRGASYAGEREHGGPVTGVTERADQVSAGGVTQTGASEWSTR